MSRPVPDLPGYADAQAALRQRFGERVDFLHAASVTFPPGTAIDPETQMPYDPTVEPASSAVPTASAWCTIATKPSKVVPVTPGPIGFVESDDVMVATDLAASAVVSGAEHMVVRDERYLITAMKPDGIAGRQRWLTFGKRE